MAQTLPTHRDVSEAHRAAILRHKLRDLWTVQDGPSQTVQQICPHDNEFDTQFDQPQPSTTNTVNHHCSSILSIEQSLCWTKCHKFGQKHTIPS